MCEKELLNHRNSFIEGNLSETRCIETCSVCLRLFVDVFFSFFALNSFEDVESKTFIVRLSVERVPELSFVQLSSPPAASATAADGPRRKSCPRQHAAARGGAERPRRSGGVFAEQRRRGGRQGRRWPGASEAGPRKSRLRCGISVGFPSLEILRKMFEFSANVVQNREFPALNMQKMLESMITCSVLII